MESSDPRFICKLPSGSLFLSEMQFLRGYCILRAEPQIASINDLDTKCRVDFLNDMVRIGDTLLKVTKAYRINYAIMGNSEPVLHAHIVPRFEDEPKEFLHGLPWSYPEEMKKSRTFDLVRDKELIIEITAQLIH
jgi:diadenosine tetraphosphate (Ap4A) HIT family hydrolase